MSLNDPLANALSQILNAEKIGLKKVTLRPVSSVIGKVLDVMKKEGYIGAYKVIQDGKGNQYALNLLGAINKCGVIKPRHPVKKAGFEKYEKRYLPAKDFGLLILSTPVGITEHKEAKKKGVGGRLIAYCY
jgi:small subunit ribosomal protein S8